MLKSSIEEIKALSTINSLLVAVGKSTTTNSLNVWDSRSNK